MQELMLDLETLATTPDAVVLSIGAVVWETLTKTDGDLSYNILGRYYRKPALQPQFDRGRKVSESTLLWWRQQDSVAQHEAFDSVRRPLREVFIDFDAFVRKFALNHFWANPATFDFPIWENLANQCNWMEMSEVPWKYNQKYDVRTVVNEASYRAKDHVMSRAIPGVPHTPIYDCEWQIDLLTAARNRIKRRIEG